MVTSYSHIALQASTIWSSNQQPPPIKLVSCSYFCLSIIYLEGINHSHYNNIYDSPLLFFYVTKLFLRGFSFSEWRVQFLWSGGTELGIISKLDMVTHPSFVLSASITTTRISIDKLEIRVFKRKMEIMFDWLFNNDFN